MKEIDNVSQRIDVSWYINSCRN